MHNPRRRCEVHIPIEFCDAALDHAAAILGRVLRSRQTRVLVGVLGMCSACYSGDDGTRGLGPVTTSSASDVGMMDESSSSAGPTGDGSTGAAPQPEPGTTTGSSDSSGSDGSGGGPAFSCDVVPADSPHLDGVVIFDPAQPHPGDTVSVIVRATNGTGRGEAPTMSLQATTANGQSEHAAQSVEGGDAVYYFAVPDVPRGDVCVLGRVEGQPEVAAKITVTPRPPGPPVDGGVFKVVANHQWTCGEQPSNGNELHVWVRDENGVGLEGQRVALRFADSTDPGSIYNDGVERPTELVTGADGHAQAYNYWPVSDNGLLVFNVSMADVASDVATEITTGWWEDDLMGCSYCGTPTVNVWGHWSYTVEFQRDPAAAQACVVENDHAGMSACGEPRHVHHHPDARACWDA